jgi:prepilin-type N-terminal cleavage/methylation domain-containing protein
MINWIVTGSSRAFDNPREPLKQSRQLGAGGFSLVELLAAIAIIAILFAITVTGLQKVRRSVSIAESSSALRNLGSAMALFSNENDYRLPYLRGNSQYVISQRYSQQLVDVIGEYLGGPFQAGTLVESAVSQAFIDAADPYENTCYWANPWVYNERTQSIRQPFGYRSGGPDNGLQLPMRTLDVADPSKQVALINFDRMLPRIDGGPLDGIPGLDVPLHGDMRLALFFDFSVRDIPTDQNFYYNKYW